MGDTEEARALQKCFAGLWSLDDPSASETKDIIAQAIRDPEKYILKPQREGGGNNLYGMSSHICYHLTLFLWRVVTCAFLGHI
jgi:ABC-type uncharacterized transport system substrate-binding protein